jgi:hypothetical protein
MKQSVIQEYVFDHNMCAWPSPSSRIAHVSQDVPSVRSYWSCMSPAMTTPQWMSQATILKSTHSQTTPQPPMSQGKNSQKEGNTLVIQSENVRHSSFFSLLCLQSLQRRARGCPCFDLQNPQGPGAQSSLHCKKGPPLLMSLFSRHSHHYIGYRKGTCKMVSLFRRLL